jgi:hypothetical protein
MQGTGSPPPERLSFNDERNRPLHDRILPRIIVRLDGVEQSLVAAYDCSLGLVERLVRTRSGIKTTPDGKEAQREQLRGTVTVEWKAE